MSKKINGNKKYSVTFFNLPVGSVDLERGMINPWEVLQSIRLGSLLYIS